MVNKGSSLLPPPRRDTELRQDGFLFPHLTTQTTTTTSYTRYLPGLWSTTSRVLQDNEIHGRNLLLTNSTGNVFTNNAFHVVHSGDTAEEFEIVILGSTCFRAGSDDDFVPVCEED